MRRIVGFLAVLLVAACGSAAGELPAPSASPSTAVSPSPSTPSPSPSPSTAPTPAAQHVIRISLSLQHMWAYEGETLVFSSDITTGMPALPTPTGQFRIVAKYSPYEFISPWGPGSPYYYDPLWVNYAILFADGGYFIHDAWWQTNWGPGANLKTGSHGCVNVPPSAMPALYRWATAGDLVVIMSGPATGPWR